MSAERVMLLIDADNLSVDVMEQAIRLLLNQHGGVHVRRAYCTAESAVANQAAFKRLGIKPMVNLATGKNSTDIAMAVDTMDLVLAERPDVVVIASSDSDFAPLVQRVREKGCVVRGIGQKGKVGEETQDVYDDYTVLEHRGGGTRPTRARAPAKTARTQAPVRSDLTGQESPPPADKPASRGARSARKTPVAVAVQVPAPEAPAPRRSRARKALVVLEAEVMQAEAEAEAEAEVLGRELAAAASESAPSEGLAPKRSPRGRRRAATTLEESSLVEAVQPSARKPTNKRASPAAAPADLVPASSSAASETAPSSRASLQAVLSCLPELEKGQSLALNVAVQRLREAQLLGKNSSSLKLFAQLSSQLELLPARNPSQVRLRRQPSTTVSA